MTDTIDTSQHTDRLTGRQLNLGLSTLIVEIADEVDSRFPSDGNPASTAHVANYEAHRSAYNALRSALIALPADPTYRGLVLQYIVRAAAMTGFDPQSDELVRKCIDRAADDYKPDTPDELKRTTKVTRTVSPVKADTKAPGK